MGKPRDSSSDAPTPLPSDHDRTTAELDHGRPITGQTAVIVRGEITHLHTATISTKRGTTALTAIRLIDDQPRTLRGGQPASRPTPTRYEVQFVDSKLLDWSTAIKDRFRVGDDVLVYAEEEIRVDIKPNGAAILVIHGIDLGLATQAQARRN